MHNHMIEAALGYLKLGYRPIPLVAGRKQAAVKWKRFQETPPSEQEIVRWFSAEERNIGLLCGNGVVVVDLDDPTLLDLVVRNCGATPMRCKTPSGGLHLYYTMRSGVNYGNGVRLNGRPIDLRCEGAYAVCPWSRNEHGVSYEWLTDVIPIQKLPRINVSWLHQRNRKRVVTPAIAIGDGGNSTRRARSYLCHVEGAISGKRGHDRTFRVACVLAIKFGLTFEQAWPLFLEWNTQCEPPWSEKELLHKLQDAVTLRHRRTARARS